MSSCLVRGGECNSDKKLFFGKDVIDKTLNDNQATEFMESNRINSKTQKTKK